MKTRALGFLLMVAAAGAYGVGCGSSNNNNGTGGAGDAGTGGKGGAGGGAGGAAGAGMGGKTDSGTDTGTGAGGKTDSGTDTGTSTGGKMDAGTDLAADMKTDTPMDTPVGDTPADTQAAPTFTQVFAIISDFTTDTSPGCAKCHDGVIADGGQVRLPHTLNFADKAAAYNMLVGVPSQRCPGGDGGPDAGPAFDRVLAGNADLSVLVQKLKQGLGMGTACDSIGMPLQVVTQIDGGVDAGDAGSTSTHYAITPAQLTTIVGWINAGALNN